MQPVSFNEESKADAESKSYEATTSVVSFNEESKDRVREDWNGTGSEYPLMRNRKITTVVTDVFNSILYPLMRNRKLVWVGWGARHPTPVSFNEESKDT